MSAPIFLITDDGGLIELQEQGYPVEDMLQELLASYPKLLSGDQRPATPRKWVLVTREAKLASDKEGVGRWSVDHLFLDQDGVPTLVEVKRSTDTRIRREVVGQMLDYAANAVMYWPVEQVRGFFDSNCDHEGTTPESKLTELLDGQDMEEFWIKVKTNLQAGRIRMVFVADEIPQELRRIVEFLNEQMDPAEVLAVEVRQFVGQGRRTLVPRTFGQTAESERKKSAGVREQKQWNEELFFEELGRRSSDEVVAVARDILEWAVRSGMRIWWGKGKVDGSFIPVLDFGGHAHSLIAVWTGGILSVQFGYMLRRPPFTDLRKRTELANRLNQIPGVSIPPDAIDRFPSIPLTVFRDPKHRSRLLSTLDWAVEEIRSHQP